MTLLPRLLSLSLAFSFAFSLDRTSLEGLARGKVEVKEFIEKDLPLYHNLVFKHIPGADPELVLLDSYYKELQRVALEEMTRDQIVELLSELGFHRKPSLDAPVAPEYLFAPLHPKHTSKNDL